MLVVDDDRDASTALKMLLELDGYRVATACDAAQALACIASFNPMCVLLDLGLPDMDGCQLAEQIRAEHGTALVLIAVTGRSGQEEITRAENAGIDFVLVKPISSAELQRMLPKIG